MARPRVVGIGAGGHASVILEILTLTDACEIVGLLDPRPDRHGTFVDGFEVIGDDSLLPQLHREGTQGAFIGFGGGDSTIERSRLFQLAVGHGFVMVDAVHPRAIVSGSARLGCGVSIMAGAVINPGAVIGANVIVNTGAIVEHHCRIDDHVHVAPGARLGGGVTLGAGCHVGIGAIVLPNLRIGAGATVGAGAVVTRDVEDEAVVAGVPAAPRARVDRG